MKTYREFSSSFMIDAITGQENSEVTTGLLTAILDLWYKTQARPGMEVPRFHLSSNIQEKFQSFTIRARKGCSLGESPPCILTYVCCFFMRVSVN